MYGEFDDLEALGVLDLDDEPYQFYILGVWKGEDGYYLATDSGCSCPAYWEYTTREDLTGPLTREQAIEEVESLAKDAPRFTQEELPGFLAAVFDN